MRLDFGNGAGGETLDSMKGHLVLLSLRKAVWITSKLLPNSKIL